MRWRHSFLLVVALVASACTSANATVSPAMPTAPEPSQIAAAPTNTLPPLVAPTQAPTTTLLPTSTPPPTSRPEPSIVPTALPTAAPATVATATPVPTATQAPTQPLSATAPSQLLFLRGGDLYALNMDTRKETLLVEDVRDVVPSVDGAQLALLRGTAAATELWRAQRDGSGLTQLTKNTRAEATPRWSPDGQAVIYASSTAGMPYELDWFTWSNWCASSEIRVLEFGTLTEITLAPGCDPAVSPDGRRVAFAAPPARAASGYDAGGPREGNSIRLINRQGQNGWNFAKAGGTSSQSGIVVYAPSWTPDGSHVLYQRFVGMQVEVSINLTEIGRSFEGKGRALDDGAGWMLAAQPGPGGKIVAITEHNYDNARGLTGYGMWSVSLVRLQGQREVPMPSGPQMMLGQELGRLPAGQRTAWAPDGAALAVQLPESWKPGADIEQFGEGQGTIWRWQPGANPSEQLVDDVDFASPIYWLPAR